MKFSSMFLVALDFSLFVPLISNRRLSGSRAATTHIQAFTHWYFLLTSVYLTHLFVYKGVVNPALTERMMHFPRDCVRSKSKAVQKKKNGNSAGGFAQGIRE